MGTPLDSSTILVQMIFRVKLRLSGEESQCKQKEQQSSSSAVGTA